MEPAERDEGDEEEGNSEIEVVRGGANCFAEAWVRAIKQLIEQGFSLAW